MKGVVFNLLEVVVGRHYGEDVWEDLLDAAGLDGVYTSLGSYPDAEMEALVAAAAGKLGFTRDDVLRWFGREAIPVLAERYPVFFENLTSSRPFVQGVNHIIHAEVRKLYPGAECPHFQFRESSEDTLVMEYLSSRRLCALAQGFVEGAASYFNETVDFEHKACVQHGDPNCLFHVAWA